MSPSFRQLCDGVLRARRGSWELPEGPQPSPLDRGAGFRSSLALLILLSAAAAVFSSLGNEASKIHCLVHHTRAGHHRSAGGAPGPSLHPSQGEEKRQESERLMEQERN